MIENGIGAKVKQEIKDSSALEAMSHAQFAQQNVQYFTDEVTSLNR